MRILTAIVTLVLCTLSLNAHAGPSADALGKCLADNTTGKERKDLARWIFLAMSTHPEIKRFSTTTSADLEQSSKTTGALFTKLLTESCVTELRATVQAEGPQSLQAAFSTLGQVAMQELMSDGGVNAAIGAFERHMDLKRIEAVLEPK